MAKNGNSKRVPVGMGWVQVRGPKEQLRKCKWLPEYPSGTGIIQLVPMVAFYGRRSVVKE
jgi:hypothetical protein